MPDRLEAPGAADQGDRGRVAAAGRGAAGGYFLNQSTVIPGEINMPTILGSGDHRYRVVENFAKLPTGWSLTDVASVAVDSKDRLYVFNRGAHPMVVLD